MTFCDSSPVKPVPVNPPQLEINKLHGELVAIARDGLKRAIEIGRLLEDQKSALKHGEWLPWLRLNITFSTQTADRYRNLYRHREKFLTVGNLSLTDAYRIAAESAVDQQSARPSQDQRAPLSHAEKQRLAECEERIDRWLPALASVAGPVMEIRSRMTHKAFEAWCNDRLGLDLEIAEMILKLLGHLD